VDGWQQTGADPCSWPRVDPHPPRRVRMTERPVPSREYSSPLRTTGRSRGGVRGRERTGSTRSHPEPGRDPVQRRRVLRGRPRGRRGRCGHHRATYHSTLTTHPPQTTRGGAAAARWAHNPKVAGSNPAPATTLKGGIPTPGMPPLFVPPSRGRVTLRSVKSSQD
jgi:hypothetical protein